MEPIDRKTIREDIIKGEMYYNQPGQPNLSKKKLTSIEDCIY